MGKLIVMKRTISILHEAKRADDLNKITEKYNILDNSNPKYFEIALKS